MNEHITKLLADHHFVDRDLYYQNCYCRCGMEFDYREHPVKRWSEHVGRLLCQTVQKYSMNLHPEPWG